MDIFSWAEGSFTGRLGGSSNGESTQSHGRHFTVRRGPSHTNVRMEGATERFKTQPEAPTPRRFGPSPMPERLSRGQSAFAPQDATAVQLLLPGAIRCEESTGRRHPDSGSRLTAFVFVSHVRQQPNPFHARSFPTRERLGQENVIAGIGGRHPSPARLSTARRSPTSHVRLAGRPLCRDTFEAICPGLSQRWNVLRNRSVAA